jgi:hypothetical protein
VTFPDTKWEGLKSNLNLYHASLRQAEMEGIIAGASPGKDLATVLGGDTCTYSTHEKKSIQEVLVKTICC